MTIVDKNETRTLHPSLDIKDNILILGFRLKKDDGKDVDIYIHRIKDEVYITEIPGFNLEDGTSISIEKKKRLLAKLSQKWSANGLNKFMESVKDPFGEQLPKVGLYNKIKDSLRLYVEFENEADYSILTAWIIGSYLFPMFSAYPYIHIKAPKGSGKSQCLNFILQTAFNAVKARASLPALRDTVDSLRGTYILDQADCLYRINMEDILDIFTDSYKRGGGGIRKMIPNKRGWTVEEFDAFGPKAFGSIAQLPEDLRDRCIVIPLIKSKKNHPQINEEDTIWKEIRGELYSLLINHFQYISSIHIFKKIEYKENGSLLGRQLELWLPIETILSSLSVPEEEIEISKKRFLSRYEFASYQSTEIEGAVIDTIISLMKDKEDIVLHPKEIMEKIDSELFEEEDQFMSQKKRSTVVGRAINKFNLATSKLTRDSQGERYLFTKDHLQKIRDSYFAENDKKDTPSYIEEKTPIQSTF
ncbi:MAG: hypothetical protein A2431_00525 [Candidatus Zambryskibacteria bacterium RIFOXYC1_FULL_39_10]|uniref:DUF3631 domain-containing protein n=1 Tax=Candidatus Zambryskibacteria bacterium RIFOXYC1_FULL_39_10 TaxID=1802779 RepID=A0A1G2UZ94_9BACT|nr:MAG: hypothetical protein A2431_00525 [Candidatus Zambryskibacteria bacterium RIFOXYC1_FULL_39_10]OHB15630.1 MAG: hypothetical protein A2605_02385 [Candidatus Zambryskibacteria bacterium RIFOXYD1_FULL_39_35]